MARYKYAKDRREQILQALGRLLRDHPFDSITLRMIETESGISHRMFYYYFQNKEDILRSFMAMTWEPFLRNQDLALEKLSEEQKENMSNGERIRFILHAALDDHFEENSSYLFGLFAAVNNQALSSCYRTISRPYYREFSDRLRRIGLPEEKCDQLSLLLTVIIDGIVMDAQFESKETMLNLIDELPDLLI